MSSVLPPLPPKIAKSKPFVAVAPNLGLYLGRTGLEVPDRGFTDCNNIRIKNRKVTNENIGWEKLFATALGGQVTLCETYLNSAGTYTTIFGTKTDLFRYDQGTNLPVYITPIYAAGTISTTSGDPHIVGAGTLWLANVKAGDQIAVGSATESAVSATWYTVLTVVDDTHITLTANYVGTTAGGKPYTARKLFTATDLDHWETDVFPDAPLGTSSGFSAGDRWFATNSKEIVAWDFSAARAVDITASLGFTCRTLCYFKNMMLYGYITEGGVIRPSNFKNSAIADPENVTTLEANEQIMAQSVDFLFAIRRLGDYAIGYCDGSTNVVQFVESPFYFAIRTAGPDIGIFASRTVVNFGDYHEFLGKDQAYQFDGVRFLPYGSHVFDEILQRVDRARAEKAVAYISKADREIYWVLPLVSDGTTSTKSAEVAWVEHYAEQVGSAPTPFTKRDLPATAMGKFKTSPLSRWSDFTGFTFATLTQQFVASYFSSGYPILLFGDENGYIYKLGTKTGKDTAAGLESYFVSPTRPLVNGRARGVVRRVEPFVEKRSTETELAIRVLTTERVLGDETPEDAGVRIDHSGDRFAAVRNAGLYASVKMSTSLATDIWALSGYRVDSDSLGER